MKKITIEVSWGEGQFKVGTEYTHSEIMSWRKEYQSPKNLTQAFKTATKILRHDCEILWNNFCKETKYLLTEVLEIYRNGRRSFVLCFIAGLSVPITSFTLAKSLPFSEMASSQINAGNGVTCLSCGIDPNYVPTAYNKSELEEIVKPIKLTKERAKKIKELKLKKEIGKTKKAHRDLIMSMIDVNTLPKISLPDINSGDNVRKSNNKFFFTENQFKNYLKLYKAKIRQYETEYRINPDVETARHTYEAWQRTSVIVNKVVIHGWKPSDLFVASGNGSGIKTFNRNMPHVIKYDDGYNPCNSKGESMFVLFQRNDFYDLDNYVRYHATKTLQNKHYYNPEHRDYKNVNAYCKEFKSYATKHDYVETLKSRTKMVKKMGI